MALTWISYRCRRCRRTLELPLIWAKHQHGLHCNVCRGKLHRVPPVQHRRAS
jgi:DNA-directed RNA polymerase subunit RPC12/RpoP